MIDPAGTRQWASTEHVNTIKLVQYRQTVPAGGLARCHGHDRRLLLGYGTPCAVPASNSRAPRGVRDRLQLLDHRRVKAVTDPTQGHTRILVGVPVCASGECTANGQALLYSVHATPRGWTCQPATPAKSCDLLLPAARRLCRSLHGSRRPVTPAYGLNACQRTAAAMSTLPREGGSAERCRWSTTLRPLGGRCCCCYRTGQPTEPMARSCARLMNSS